MIYYSSRYKQVLQCIVQYIPSKNVMDSSKKGFSNDMLLLWYLVCIKNVYEVFILTIFNEMRVFFLDNVFNEDSVKNEFNTINVKIIWYNFVLLCIVLKESSTNCLHSSFTYLEILVLPIEILSSLLLTLRIIYVAF